MKQFEIIGFFLAGLLNNSSFVIMIAGAKDIAPSLVGLVYVCNILPSFIVKLSGPYWFHYVPYKSRVILAAILMVSSFTVVSTGLMIDSVSLMLTGVALGSTQCGFGESSFLALTSFYDSRLALTAWSSGTGLAGIFGFAWVVIFSVIFKLSFRYTLLYALAIPVLYVLNFVFILSPSSDADSDDSAHASLLDNDPENEPITTRIPFQRKSPRSKDDLLAHNNFSAASIFTAKERLDITLTLWPYMIPLFVVYFAEYAMESGVWAAIGFPIDSETARKNFYRYSNWMYQAGVLVSRSSGMLWKADMKALWVMPMLQVCLLVFFILDAFNQWWYDWSLLALCFVVGLFGGAVYVGGFALIAETVPLEQKEFSLSAASLGSDIGIACSNIAGIFIQRALYRYHDISDD